MRRDFVANASHELRTPVAAVRSAAETLRGAIKKDPKGAARFAEMIERNAERLQRLVDDLLDLSRIEAEGFRIETGALAVADVVSRVVESFRDGAERGRIVLTSELPADLPPARAERVAMEHVLSNLVDNAVKYAGEGARVVVRGREEDSFVRVEVSDTGPGIEARHLPRLFERFYRVDAGRSRELGGTGLGLAIVRHLVEAMGGSAGVESTPGRGSTFFVTLPRA